MIRKHMTPYTAASLAITTLVSALGGLPAAAADCNLKEETRLLSNTVPPLWIPPVLDTEANAETETEESESETEEPVRLFGSPILPIEEPVSDDIVIYELPDYLELPGFTLPSIPKTFSMLEEQLRTLTASYSGTWSIYVKNLSTQETLLLHDEPMKSASVMKLFIMGAVYQAIEQGTLERTGEVVDLLNSMISYSSNEAANRLLLLLGEGSYRDGITVVNTYVDDQGYTDLTHEYNGFEDSSAYVDTDHFNQITAKDCGDLLERIYHRTFASRSVCNEIETMMLAQDTRYKIPRGLPEGVLVGNKTGEMDTVENDVAIIYSDACDYILCVLSNDWNSKDEAQYHIQEISSKVYHFLNDIE